MFGVSAFESCDFLIANAVLKPNINPLQMIAVVSFVINLRFSGVRVRVSLGGPSKWLCAKISVCHVMYNLHSPSDTNSRFRSSL